MSFGFNPRRVSPPSAPTRARGTASRYGIAPCLVSIGGHGERRHTDGSAQPPLAIAGWPSLRYPWKIGISFR